MIKLFIYSLIAIVLALVVTLYLGFPGDPGYLLFAFGSYTFETSLFALLVASGVIYLVVKLLLIVFNWINPIQLVRLGKNLNDQRKAKSRSSTVEGILFLARGNWASSFGLLTKGIKESDGSVVNYLAAAYAAFEMGDRESWMSCLDKAEEEIPLARSTVNSVKAKLLYKSNQLEQCLAVLEQLKKTSLNDMSLLTMLKDVYIKLQDWEKLSNLLPTLQKNKVIDAEEMQLIEMRIFMEELYSIFDKADGRSIEASFKRDAVTEMTKIWQKSPASYKATQKVVKHYAKLLFELNAKPEAAKVIEIALTKSWSNPLISIYGEQDFEVNQQQLLMAETWLKTRPADDKLLLSLGRISMRNELWGKAKEYYQASIKISPSAEAYVELSRLLSHLGEDAASEIYLRNYGDLLGNNLPELPLPELPKATQ